MFGTQLVVTLAATLLVHSQDLQNSPIESMEKTMLNDPVVERSERFFPLFSVVRFANSECSANYNFNGTCFTRRECSKYGGTPSGICANGLGICCVFQKTCGSTTNMNNTYFINPDYPSTFQGGQRCTITVNRCNSNICQLRLDFLDFSMAQPNASGACDYDLFLASGGSSQVPRLCGENTNQHVYVDFNDGAPITLSIDTLSDYAFERRWNIRIQQIACDSVWRAPNGCLQYYKGVSDTVSSFNYGTTTNSRAPMVGTRQMRNLNYGVCIRMALGYCSIEWSQTDPNSFTVSGDTDSVDPSIIGTDMVAMSGMDCTTDFVIIANPKENGTNVNTERFCGNGFITKTSDLKPFVLYVVTDNNEDEDMQNRGFMLAYRQLPCAM